MTHAIPFGYLLAIDIDGQKVHNTYMTTAQQIADAISHRDAARSAYNAATTSKARRLAGEDLDWWIGKVAMLTVMAGES